MPNSDIISLSKLLGAKNVYNSPFARSPVGLNYINQEGNSDNAQRLLDQASTPVGAIGAGINYYIQSKEKKKAIDALGEELKAEASAKEQNRSTLASLFPEEQRGIASTLDIDTLTKLASEKLAPRNEVSEIDTNLDRDYKRAQINKLYKEANNIGRAGQGKPLPVQALKLQNEELDTIGTLGGINADLNNVQQQIDNKKLKLGPVENLLSRAKNYTGMSDDNSRNFATFKSTLEKQRNDSLRLNKGVQTEGDAQRAWSEIFDNLNDGPLIKKRLAEIQAINQRGADLKKLNIDQIRANYGAEPMDYSNYNNRPAAIGNGQQNSGFKILNIRNN